MCKVNGSNAAHHLRVLASVVLAAALSGCGVAPEIPGVAGFMKPDAPLLQQPAAPQLEPQQHRLKAAAATPTAPDVAQPSGQLIVSGAGVRIVGQVQQAALDGLRVVSRLERELIRGGFNLQSGAVNNMQGADGQPMPMDALLQEVRSGGTAQYLFLLTELDSSATRQVSGDLTRTDAFAALVKAHPQHADALRAKAQFACAVPGVRASARLIDLQSGRVVWLGSHAKFLGEPSGSDAAELLVSLQPVVANQDEVDAYYAEANSETGRQQRTRRPEQYPKPPAYRTELQLAQADWISGPCASQESAPLSADQARQLTAQLLTELIATIELGASPETGV